MGTTGASLALLAAVSVAAVFKVLIVVSICEAWRLRDRAAGVALMSFGLAELAFFVLSRV